MKSYHIILIASVCFMLSSCGTVSYFGDRLTPTSNVDIYYSAHDVPKAYKVIGHMTFPTGNRSPETVKAKFADYAKSVGADAVIITGGQGTKDDQAAYITADALKYN